MKVTSYYHRTNPDEAGYSLGNFVEIWAPASMLPGSGR